jgi:hypothetical protein
MTHPLIVLVWAVSLNQLYVLEWEKPFHPWAKREVGHNGWTGNHYDGRE